MFTKVKARLVLVYNTKPNDRDEAQYILSMGADYWRILTVEWASDWSANGDEGIGRFRFVTKQWESFNKNTCRSAFIYQHLPPHK